MPDPFIAYASKANTIAKHHPVPLIGRIKTRRAAMIRYQEIVTEIIACDDEDMLTCYLVSIGGDIAQFRAELDFLWKGDGDDFPGLSGEIAAKRAQFRAQPESEAERLFGQF